MLGEDIPQQRDAKGQHRQRRHREHEHRAPALRLAARDAGRDGDGELDEPAHAMRRVVAGSKK